MIIQGIEYLKAEHKPCVATIGNFDGVHLGHQHVIRTLLQQSKKQNLKSVVITFDPFSWEFFKPQSNIKLMSFEQRAQRLLELGVDYVLCVEFNQQLAELTADEFIKSVLIEGLGIKYLCVGDDFRFGKGRGGDFSLLQTYGKKYEFAVRDHYTFEVEGERVSSGRVRQALQDDDVELATRLLGQPFSMQGVVTKGEQRGRLLSFPTANIPLDDSILLPVSGVYAVQVVLAGGETFPGVANVGNRPTVDGKENRIEAHIFDFDQDIYGQQIEVVFIKKIRDEQKFDSLDKLKTQITSDAESAIQILAASKGKKR